MLIKWIEKREKRIDFGTTKEMNRRNELENFAQMKTMNLFNPLNNISINWRKKNGVLIEGKRVSGKNFAVFKN